MGHHLVEIGDFFGQAMVDVRAVGIPFQYDNGECQPPMGCQTVSIPESGVYLQFKQFWYD